MQRRNSSGNAKKQPQETHSQAAHGCSGNIGSGNRAQLNGPRQSESSGSRFEEARVDENQAPLVALIEGS
jgi:hypothetical protein